MNIRHAKLRLFSSSGFNLIVNLTDPHPQLSKRTHTQTYPCVCVFVLVSVCVRAYVCVYMYLPNASITVVPYPLYGYVKRT